MAPIVAAVRSWFSSKQFSYLILLLLGLGNKAVSIESGYFHSSAPQPYREVPQDTPGTGKIVEHLFQVKKQSVFQAQLELQLGSGNAAACPASNNETYYTSNGIFFVVLCTQHNWGAVYSNVPAASLQECIDKCGHDPTCKSVNYQFTSDYECSLQSDLGGSAVDCPNHHFAYQIDPPTQPAPDEDLIACSTSCPTGNGLSYVSKVGETFRINCGKRHGTPPFKQNHQGSLRECMDACAESLSCSSVDYHDDSGTCYYSNHHGEPTILTSGFSSAYAIGCAGACPAPAPPAPTCQPVPTEPVPSSTLSASSAPSSASTDSSSSTFVTSTSANPTPSAPPLPDVSCGNQGLQYAIFPNKKPNGSSNKNTDAKYTSFDPSVFMSIIKPQFTGVTNSVGVTATNTIYGHTPSDYSYVAVNHRTYLYTYMDGNFTFNVPDCDDITIVWIGDKAYSGYSRQNAQLVQNYVPNGGNSLTYTVPLAKGMYLPVRVIFGNGGGPGRFGFTITGPDGTVIVSRDTKTPSPYLVQYSCDLGIKAPKFPDWGMET